MPGEPTASGGPGAPGYHRWDLQGKRNGEGATVTAASVTLKVQLTGDLLCEKQVWRRVHKPPGKLGAGVRQGADRGTGW